MIKAIALSVIYAAVCDKAIIVVTEMRGEYSPLIARAKRRDFLSGCSPLVVNSSTCNKTIIVMVAKFFHIGCDVNFV